MCTSILRRKLNKGLCLFSTKLVQIVHSYTPTRTHKGGRQSDFTLCHLKATTATTTRKPERWHSLSHRVPHTHTPQHSRLPCIVSGRVWVWHYLAHSWLAIWALKSMLCESLPFISIIHVQEKARERKRVPGES